MNLNSVETNPKHRTYYFYCFFKAFLQVAAENDSISDLSEYEAIKKVTEKPINTHFLARILTYYNISHQNLISIPEILAKYKSTFYPQAQQIIHEKFKISFKKPNKIHFSILSCTRPKVQQQQLNNNLTDKTIESTPSSPKTSHTQIPSSSF